MQEKKNRTIEDFFCEKAKKIVEAPEIPESAAASFSLAVQFLGEEKCAQLLEENMVAVYQRFLHVAEDFDRRPFAEKLEIVLQVWDFFVEELHDQQQKAMVFSKPVHDKKKRKQERKEKDGGIDLSEERAVCAKTIFSRAFPEGVDSLILPFGAKLFSTKMTQMLLQLEVFFEESCEKILSKKNKEHLFGLILQQFEKWCTEGCPCSEKSFVADVYVVDKIEQKIPFLVEIFLSPVWKVGKYIPKRTLATYIANGIVGMVHTLSVKELLLQVSQKFLHNTKRQTEPLTEEQLGKLCLNKAIPLGLIYRFFPEEKKQISLETPKNFLQVMIDVLSTSSKKEMALHFLKIFPWQELSFHIMTVLKQFCLSSYCNKAIYSSLSQIFKK